VQPAARKTARPHGTSRRSPAGGGARILASERAEVKVTPDSRRVDSLMQYLQRTILLSSLRPGKEHMQPRDHSKKINKNKALNLSWRKMIGAFTRSPLAHICRFRVRGELAA